jgi:hypothetical protein
MEKLFDFRGDIDNDNIFRGNILIIFLNLISFFRGNKNKKGAHLFYVLKRGIYFKNTYYNQIWKILQKQYTILSGGDKLNKGYVGKFINSEHFEYIERNSNAYTINELLKYVDDDILQKELQSLKLFGNSNNYNFYKNKSKNNIHRNKNIETIEKGERNQSLFDFTRKYAYMRIKQDFHIDSTNFSEDINYYITNLNNKLKEPLPYSEIKATAKSIIKYCLNNIEKIKKYFADPSKKYKNIGIMDLIDKKISIKEKQKMGALYSAKQKVDKTIKKIKDAIKNINLNTYENKKDINISKLAKYIKISRTTLYKYKELLPI